MTDTTDYMQAQSADDKPSAFNRDIRLFCLSNIIGAFGEGMYFWVFPLYITQELKADPVQLGLFFSVIYAASAAAPILGGLLADRFDPKKILILGWTPWVFAPLLYSFAQNTMQLVPGAILFGISMIGVPAANAYVMASVADKKRQTSVLTVVWGSYSFSYIFAPAVGALLATFIGMRWVLRLASLFCALATMVFVFLRSQHRQDCKPDAQHPSSVETTGLWRRILVWSAFLTATTFFVTVARPFVPTFLGSKAGLSEFYVGLFGSVSFAGITLIGITAGRLGDKRRKSTAISLCLALYSTSLVAILMLSNQYVLMLAAFPFGASAIIATLVSSYVGTIAPEDRRAFFISIPQTLSLVAAVPAPYVGGYLYAISPYYALIASLIPLPLLALFAITKLKA